MVLQFCYSSSSLAVCVCAEDLFCISHDLPNTFSERPAICNDRIPAKLVHRAWCGPCDALNMYVYMNRISVSSLCACMYVCMHVLMHTTMVCSVLNMFLCVCMCVRARICKGLWVCVACARVCLGINFVFV